HPCHGTNSTNSVAARKKYFQQRSNLVHDAFSVLSVSRTSMSTGLSSASGLGWNVRCTRYSLYRTVSSANTANASHLRAPCSQTTVLLMDLSSTIMSTSPSTTPTSSITMEMSNCSFAELAAWSLRS